MKPLKYTALLWTAMDEFPEVRQRDCGHEHVWATLAAKCGKRLVQEAEKSSLFYKCRYEIKVVK